jgi:lysyl-tRNA synthetase class II
MSVEDLTAAINSKEEEIRAVKADNTPTLLVEELLALKVSFKQVTGTDFGGDKAKKEKAAVAEAPREGPSKSELNKEKKKAYKAKLREEARQAAGVAARVAIAASATEENNELSHLFGDYPLIQSKFMTEKAYRYVEDLNEDYIGQFIWIRARVATSRAIGKGCFLLLRQNVSTVQAVMFQGSTVPKAMVKYASAIYLESVIDVFAKVIQPEMPIVSATIKNLDLDVQEIYVVSRAQDLPFMVEDAGRNEEDAIAASLPVVGADLALNYRWIDTRTPANQAIFRIQSGVCQLFREYFISKKFIEIHTPKLLGGASEGGASVFKLDYFGRPACLAQSPQFYKQMVCACGGFDRVFEIGPVFRAENANTHR